MPTVVIDVLTSVMIKGITSDLSGITLSTVSSELGGKSSLSPTGHFPQPGLLGKLGSLQGQVSMTGQEECGLGPLVPQRSSPSQSSLLCFINCLTLINVLAL